jgi:hypothetical protein
MNDNVKYMLPPAGCDGNVPVYQVENNMSVKDYLLYLKGVADATGWICLSRDLMEEIADNYRLVDEWGNRRKFENDRLKESIDRYVKKLKELKK